MAHIFISYVRENRAVIDRLCDALRRGGLDVWLDREQIQPGQRWQGAIRSAIRGGAYFLACFSKEYARRSRSYMNEELTLAIEELRQRPSDRTWFIPVRLSANEVPDLSIGKGESLRDIQWVDLFGDWQAGVQRLIRALTPDEIATAKLSTHGDEIEVYGIENLHRWPYESVISMNIARLSEPLALASDPRKDTKYRCYDGGRQQYFNWCLVPHNLYADMPDNGSYYDEVSPSYLLRPHERWIQIEYVMFHSILASDDSKLDRARRANASGGLDVDALPAPMRPDRVQLGSLADPHFQWYEHRTKIEEASTTLFLSQISDVPYINNHTIPDGIDYEYVIACIYSYRTYRVAPSYFDALTTLQTYCRWFSRYLPERTPPASESLRASEDKARRVGDPARPKPVRGRRKRPERRR